MLTLDQSHAKRRVRISIPPPFPHVSDVLTAK